MFWLWVFTTLDWHNILYDTLEFVNHSELNSPGRLLILRLSHQPPHTVHCLVLSNLQNLLISLRMI